MKTCFHSVRPLGPELEAEGAKSKHRVSTLYFGKYYLLTWQLAKFCTIGTLNTFLHFGVYYCLTRFFGFHFLVSNGLAFMMAATSSYFLNKFWTFKDKSKDYHKQYPKFVMIAAFGLAMHEGLLYLFVKYFMIHDLLALIIAALIVVFWNFFMNRHWTFSDSKLS